MQNEKQMKKDLMEWRRSQVLEMVSKGKSLTEIAGILKVSISSISRDLSFLKEQAKKNIKSYIDVELPLDYSKCMIGINEILKESWSEALDAHNPKEKRDWLVLAKESYAMKLDLLTNAAVIDKAIEFLSLKKEHLGKDDDGEKEVNSEEKRIDIQGSSEENTARESNTRNHTF
jgi:hypothetical protein